jgi:ABC-type Na+ efflux pump permease subunit
MSKILVIANREFRAIVGTKAFLIVITMMPILMFGGIAVQKMLEGRVGPTQKTVVVLDGTGTLFDALATAADQHNENEIFDLASGKQIKPRIALLSGPPGEVTQERRFQLSEQVRRREIDAFLEIPAGVDKMPADNDLPHSVAKVSLYAENAAMMMDEQNWLRNVLSNLLRMRRLQAANIDPALVDRASAPVMVEPLGLVAQAQGGAFSAAREANVQESIFLPFGLMMLMFMTIFLAAQPMLESVLEEKSQRIAEVLLGSVNATQLMAGKLLGGLGGSLTVVVTYASGAAAVAWYFDALHLIPLRLVPWFLVYQVLAVMMFGSLFMAVGAACNQLKEAQSMLMPIWLLMAVPLFVWLQVVRDPTGAFATWLSFILPATPLLMVLRMGASSAVPWWQPALGILIMLAATWLCVFAAARVFRIGILAQGKTPKLAELLRWAVRG